MDPVRFIGNHSSGIMGYALAEEAASRGAKVILVSGPTALTISNPAIKRIDVTSSDEMLEQCMTYFNTADITIMAAAVADYKPKTIVSNKIKKTDANLNIELVPTIDILSALGKKKNKHQQLIGFALETTNEMQNALKKRYTKNLDMIVLNSLKDKGAGFKHTTNKVTIIDKSDNHFIFELKNKTEVAKDILDMIEKNLMPNNN